MVQFAETLMPSSGNDSTFLNLVCCMTTVYVISIASAFPGVYQAHTLTHVKVLEAESSEVQVARYPLFNYCQAIHLRRHWIDTVAMVRYMP